MLELLSPDRFYLNLRLTSDVHLEGLQKDLGISLPDSTQWDLVSSAQSILLPPHEELVRQAALGDVVFNDDTTMKLLSVAAANALKVDSDKEQTGVFTSGIVSQKDNCTIALFYTGINMLEKIWPGYSRSVLRTWLLPFKCQTHFHEISKTSVPMAPSRPSSPLVWHIHGVSLFRRSPSPLL